MSKVEVIKCDQCGKQVGDGERYYHFDDAFCGWVSAYSGMSRVDGTRFDLCQDCLGTLRLTMHMGDE